MKKPKKPRISLFISHPICSAHCAVAMYEALYQKYDVRSFTPEQIKPKLFKQSSIIAFPGGEGDSDKFNTIVRPYMDSILEALDKGKRYLGVCMGAYWAGPRYFDILNKVDAVQYITRPRADVIRSYPTTAEIMWNDTKQQMYFYDGCALVGNGKFDTIATYKNGDPMAIMQNRIGLIGCHLESMQSWYSKPYMKKYWHRNTHHRLLVEFVDALMER